MNALLAFILDALALLAFMRNEPGADRVAAALFDGVAISTVNYAEVLTRLADGGESVATLRQRIADAGLSPTLLTIVAFTEEDAIAAAALRPATRQFGPSLGDRACLALAQRLQRPVLAADAPGRRWPSVWRYA